MNELSIFYISFSLFNVTTSPFRAKLVKHSKVDISSFKVRVVLWTYYCTLEKLFSLILSNRIQQGLIQSIT